MIDHYLRESGIHFYLLLSAFVTMLEYYFSYSGQKFSLEAKIKYRPLKTTDSFL